FAEGTPNASEKMAMPGDNVELDCELFHDLAMDVGSRFTLREAHKTIGTGVVTKILERVIQCSSSASLSLGLDICPVLGQGGNGRPC
ncbi:hypothetical protein MPER_15218, partial [Moniliophthora perniciosa FA553]